MVSTPGFWIRATYEAAVAIGAGQLAERIAYAIPATLTARSARLLEEAEDLAWFRRFAPHPQARTLREVEELGGVPGYRLVEDALEERIVRYVHGHLSEIATGPGT